MSAPGGTSMTAEQVAQIIDQRFAEWKPGLVRENATPIIAVGIGHGRTSGTVVIETMHEMPDDALEGFLKQALKLLKRRRRGK